MYQVSYFPKREVLRCGRGCKCMQTDGWVHAVISYKEFGMLMYKEVQEVTMRKMMVEEIKCSVLASYATFLGNFNCLN